MRKPLDIMFRALASKRACEIVVNATVALIILAAFAAVVVSWAGGGK